MFNRVLAGVGFILVPQNNLLPHAICLLVAFSVLNSAEASNSFSDGVILKNEAAEVVRCGMVMILLTRLFVCTIISYQDSLLVVLCQISSRNALRLINSVET